VSGGFKRSGVFGLAGVFVVIRSLRLGMVVTLLIFLTVPAIYPLESFVPRLIGGPLIAIVALYGSFRALAPGGELDRGYELADRAMAPLRLEVSERTVRAPVPEFEAKAKAKDGRVRPADGGPAAMAGRAPRLPLARLSFPPLCG